MKKQIKVTHNDRISILTRSEEIVDIMRKFLNELDKAKQLDPDAHVSHNISLDYYSSDFEYMELSVLRWETDEECKARIAEQEKYDNERKKLQREEAKRRIQERDDFFKQEVVNKLNKDKKFRQELQQLLDSKNE